MKKLSTNLTAAVITLGLTALPTVAFAHTEVIGSTPAAESTVENGKVVDIDIEFGEALMQAPDGAGSEIQITSDADGTEQAVGCIVTDGAHLTAKAVLTTSGPATVTWRAVADDGHPVSDSFTINVAESDGSEAEDLMAACPQMLMANNVGGVAEDSDAKNTDSSGGLLGLGVGIFFIVIFSVIGGIQAKRRMDKEDRENK